jgi:hypothetical protein
MSRKNLFHNENVTEAIDVSDLSSCKVTATLNRRFNGAESFSPEHPLTRSHHPSLNSRLTVLNPVNILLPYLRPTLRPFSISRVIQTCCVTFVSFLWFWYNVMSLTNPQAKNHPFLAVHNGVFNIWKTSPPSTSQWRIRSLLTSGRVTQNVEQIPHTTVFCLCERVPLSMSEC